MKLCARRRIHMEDFCPAIKDKDAIGHAFKNSFKLVCTRRRLSLRAVESGNIVGDNNSSIDSAFCIVQRRGAKRCKTFLAGGIEKAQLLAGDGFTT